jgi:tetratricopeptide (TPR) repeat protein
MKRSRNKSYPLLIPVVIVLATVVAFEPMRHNEFIDYDDDLYVTENPHVIAGLTVESVVWAFTTRHATNWHPLTWLSHMLDCQMFGVEPFWHHLTSLMFHIASTLLLFYLLRKMTGAVWRSAFVAAAFALHPLHVESVAWVAERKDVLSGLFWMLTILAYMRYVEQPRIGRYLLVILFFSLGLMAKPMLVTLPFVLLLLDYWPLRRLRWARQSSRGSLSESESVTPVRLGCSPYMLLREKVPLLALVVVSCIITFIVQQKWGAILPLAFPLRLLNCLVSYLRYIEKIVWPSGLALLYMHPTYKVLLWPTIAAVILLPAVTFRVIRLAKTHRYLPVGWLWYLGTLVPVIGLVQVGNQAMADRYMYLPSVGIFIIVAWGAVDLLAEWQYRKIALAVSAGLLLAAMLVCTRMQVHHWRNSLTVFRRAVAVTTNNYIMRTKYGRAIFNEGRVDKAIAQFNEALRVEPRHLEARIGLGDAFMMQGRLDEAIVCFNEVLRTDQDRPRVYHNLGTAYARQDKLDLAIQNYSEALRLKPDYLSAHVNLALTLMLQGNIDEALVHCREALRIDRKDSRARQMLEQVLAKKASRTTESVPEKASQN